MGFPPDFDEAESLDADEAFALLGNEHRASIIQAIQELYAEGIYPPSFSEIRERVDAENSAQFNYHLQELAGHHVRRGDDGTYGLTHAGWSAVGAIWGGTDPQHVECSERTAESRCVGCGADVVRVDFEHTWLFVRCPDCETVRGRYPCPPSAVAGRDVTEALEQLDLVVRAEMRLAANGVCRSCHGRSRVTTFPSRDVAPEDRLFEFRCGHCADHLWTNPGVYLLELPRVRAFCEDAGVDPDDRPFWEVPFCAGDDAFGVVDTDPWRCEAVLEVGGRRLELVLDDSLQVVE